MKENLKEEIKNLIREVLKEEKDAWKEVSWKNLSNEKFNAILRDLNKQLYITKDQIKIFLVNATPIRNHFFIDFTAGGHHFAGSEGMYNFIPKNEIWIDRFMKPEDIYATVIHEIVEYRKMAEDNLDYDSAHNEASLKEEKFRHSLTSIPDHSDKNRFFRNVVDLLEI